MRVPELSASSAFAFVLCVSRVCDSDRYFLRFFRRARGGRPRGEQRPRTSGSHEGRQARTPSYTCEIGHRKVCGFSFARVLACFPLVQSRVFLLQISSCRVSLVSRPIRNCVIAQGSDGGDAEAARAIVTFACRLLYYPENTK